MQTASIGQFAARPFPEIAKNVEGKEASLDRSQMKENQPRGIIDNINRSLASASPLEANPILGLGSVQAKLTLGTVGDVYEQEADRVARQVVDEIHSSAFRASNTTSEGESIANGGEAGRVQRQITVRAAGEAGGEISSEWEGELVRAKGGGQPMSPTVREPMERAFGADFGGVRVHTGAQADMLARSIQAKAFTTGQDVFFRQGAYEPGSRGGQELIAHELTHVVQQGGEAEDKNEIIKRKVIGEVVEKSQMGEENRCKNVEKEELISAYNNAWRYIWSSEKAKTIVKYVNKHNAEVKVKVGAEKSEANGLNEVNWNPYEYNIEIDSDGRDMGEKWTDGFEQKELKGRSSAAITLLHEMGHIKQNWEAAVAAGQTGNLGYNMIDFLTKMYKILEEARKQMYEVLYLTKVPMREETEIETRKRGKVEPSYKEIVEYDNVTRHERKVAEELGERRRRHYRYDVTEKYVKGGSEMLKDMSLDERVTNSKMGEEAYESSKEINETEVLDWIIIMESEWGKLMRTWKEKKEKEEKISEPTGAWKKKLVEEAPKGIYDKWEEWNEMKGKYVKEIGREYDEKENQTEDTKEECPKM
ncbi:MAG: DUF4157 domain-containing protein [Nostoc sp.]